MAYLYYWWLVITKGAYSLSRVLTSMIFFYKISSSLCGKEKGAGSAIRNFGSGPGDYLIPAPRLRLYNTIYPQSRYQDPIPEESCRIIFIWSYLQ
jgi:hypothetical protein